MQSWFNYPKFKAIDSQGLPLNGGKLYFYEAGGAFSIPKTTYQNGAMTTEHTNPIILDANGEALIYLSGVYDVKLTDSDDVTVWTMLDAEGIGAFTYSVWEIDALTSYGAGTNYTKATIDAALTALGAVNKYTLLLRPGTWAFTVAADYSAYDNVTFLTSPGTLITSTTTIKFPDGSKFYLSNFSSLQAAIALLSTTKCTLVIDRDYAMTGDATVPANIVLEWQNGALVTTTGYTLTATASQFIAPRVRIVTGTGTVNWPSGERPPEWDGSGTSLTMVATVESYIIDEDDMASDSDTKVPTQQSVKAFVEASSPTTVSIGTIIMWAAATAPSGYLECNGASLDRTTYADLFAIIGTIYGAADGTHFNLPDYRGYFLRGWAHGTSIDPNKATRTDRGDGTGGDVIGSIQAAQAQLVSHRHTGLEILQVTGGAGPQPSVNDLTYASAGDNNASGSSWVDISQQVRTELASDSNETRPINKNIMFCIKY